MTISITDTFIQYAGTGADSVLAVPFVFDDDDELVVYKTVRSTGVSTLLVKGTHYIVTGGSFGTGSVTVVSGVTNFPVSVDWTIYRVTPRTQTTDLVDGDPLSETGLERELDKGRRIDQELEVLIQHSLRGPMADPDLMSELPSAVARSLKFLFFDSTGQPTVTDSAIPDSVTTSPQGEQLVAASTPQAVQVVIGITQGADAVRSATPPTVASWFLAQDAQRLYQAMNSTLAWKEVGVRILDGGSQMFGGTTFLWFERRTRQFYFSEVGTGVEARAPFPRGHIAGLNLSRSATTVTVSAGECRIGTTASPSQRNAIFSASFSKRLDTGAPWVAGTGNAGRPSGVSLSVDDWYHVFVLGKSSISATQTFDIGFDTLPDASNLMADANVIAAGYDLFRRIGAVMTDGSSNIIDFIQHGDEFHFKTRPGLDESWIAHDFTGADGLFVLEHVPSGVRVEALISFHVQSMNNAAIIRPGDTTVGTNPGLSGSPLGNVNGTYNIPMRILTDTSQQILYRVSTDNSSDLAIEVEGWVDARGRWD